MRILGFFIILLGVFVAFGAFVGENASEDVTNYTRLGVVAVGVLFMALGAWLARGSRAIGRGRGDA